MLYGLLCLSFLLFLAGAATIVGAEHSRRRVDREPERESYLSFGVMAILLALFFTAVVLSNG